MAFVSKILVVSRQWPPMTGGIGAFAVGLCGTLQIAAIPHIVLTPLAEQAVQRDQTEVTPYPRRWVLKHRICTAAWLVRAGLQASRKNQVSHTVCMTIYDEAFVGLALLKARGIPYSVVVHGTDLNKVSETQCLRRLVSKVLQAATFVICNSYYTKVRAEKFCASGKTVVLWPPVADLPAVAESDLARIDEEMGLAGQTVLLTTARVVPRKNHVLVLEALPALLKRHPNLVYVVTGTGECLPLLKSRIAALNLEKSVRLTGDLAPRDVITLYRRAAVYVSPGVDASGDVEGFGISFVEAAFAEVPVVAGDAGGVRDCIVDGVTGVLIKPELNALTDALLTLLSETELRVAMGRAARKHAIENFSYPAQRARVASLFGVK